MQIEPYGSLDLPELYERLVAPTLDEMIDRWLAEDLGDVGDITTLSLVAPDVETRCEVRARAHGVASGLPVLERMIGRRGGLLRAEPLAADGDRIEPGMRVMEVVGPLSALLPMERVALNLLGRLSGVATATRRFVDLIAGTGAVIVDTRKTTPGLRVLEKYAVRCGGGHLHRIGLFDGVLVKDNHIAAIDDHELAPAVEALAEAARHHGGARFIEVEVDRLEQLDSLLTLPDGVLDIILLDNMSPSMIREAVARRDKTRCDVLLEASGGIRLDTLRAVAEAGVDRIAVGAITHSAVQVDFGLDSV
jgi:nicotinate-nucleotide pyrophosphorylase (carboxylating)